MRIKEIKSSNGIKNLALKDVPFKRRTLVHGPNNCGKSNLLLLLQLAFRKKGPLPGAEQQPRFAIEGYDEARGMMTREGLSVVESGGLVISLDCFSNAFAEARKEAFPGKNSRAQSVELSLNFESIRPGTYTTIDAIKIGGKNIHTNKKPAKDDLLTALQAWVEQELVDSVVYVPNSRIHDGRPVPLDHDAELDPIGNLENAAFKFKNDPNVNPSISTELAERLENFFRITDFRAETSVTPKDGREPDEGPEPKVGIGLQNETGDWFPMSQVGTGVQQVFSILSQILVHPNASVAMIEEFETSLSQPNKNRMLELFLQMTHDTNGALRQIIATSHNTFKPAQPEFISLGAARVDGGPFVDFNEWNQADWDKFVKP